MATMEHTVNDALAELLALTRQAWRAPRIVSSENTGMLKGSAARPDILVTEQMVSPVVVETELIPALTVEQDALARLGKQIRKSGSTIYSSVAVRLPDRMRALSKAALRHELSEARDLEMALFTGDDSEHAKRWPETGWIGGGVSDLSVIVQSASVPPRVVEAAVDRLVEGVSESAELLTELG